MVNTVAVKERDVNQSASTKAKNVSCQYSSSPFPMESNCSNFSFMWSLQNWKSSTQSMSKLWNICKTSSYKSI